MTRRIGIFTYHFSENFGALMQAYGLRQWLIEQGHDAEFVNYHPRYVEEGGDFSGIFNPARFKVNLKIAYLRAATLQRRLVGNKRQSALFADFHRDVLGVTGPRLEKFENVEHFLQSPEGQFDLLICGSDQIWNPSPQFGLDPVYFLAFSEAVKSKRVAYAPSFGKGSLDPAFDGEIGRYLAHIDGLSVREQSGVDIVERITERKAVRVPDPTILLGDFSALLAKAEPVREGHVFCYALRTGEVIRDVAERISAEIRAPVISPYNVHRRWREIGETVYPSPAGWVAMIKSAAFVVTNSFHGTVLSVLLQKPFVVVGLPGAKGGLNERARNLLDQLGLLDRFLGSGAEGDVKRVMQQPIDWESVRARLVGIQSEGRQYLLENLGH